LVRLSKILAKGTCPAISSFPEEVLKYAWEQSRYIGDDGGAGVGSTVGNTHDTGDNIGVLGASILFVLGATTNEFGFVEVLVLSSSRDMYSFLSSSSILLVKLRRPGSVVGISSKISSLTSSLDFWEELLLEFG
jgi:hypothetical protein